MKLSSLSCLATVILAGHGCLLPQEMDDMVNNDLQNKANTGLAIGKGDRFRKRRNIPKGAGIGGLDDDVSILNVGEIKSGLKRLSQAYPSVRRFKAPHKTFEKRRLRGIVVGKEPRVFIISGVHARERGGPDNVLYFVSDLLAAHKEHTGLRYGNKTYTSEQVDSAFNAGLVVLPLVNPDGVAYDQKTHKCWRKNRNTQSAFEDDPRSVGVDLNRNFNTTWDYKRMFAPEAAAKKSIASDNPSSEVFHGTEPLSEPETRNVDWVLSQYPSLSWFVDVHSVGAMVLMGWGDDDFQFFDPEQSFGNSSYDGTRGILDVTRSEEASQYREFLAAHDALAEVFVVEHMREAMTEAGVIPYKAMPLSSLYPVSGCSVDHALGRCYGNDKSCNSSVLGIGIEFGPWYQKHCCPFYPDARGYKESLNQVAAGLMEVLLHAAMEMNMPRD
ncbi:hypothetical protein CDD82_3410 [Ophiocordyceps australis]|uniref:Peptidase M14 domain-containing protein n=1 Tax=Ophiocordyceps australis TaxID=1399860 RepID=A0A2C5Z9D8_9HYPO|nr:hypothetical protein CDD82_3410 [Ophiocordyceps australis]